VIDVADIDALARIAEHYERSILHDAAGAFWVSDESGQFRYCPRAPMWTPEGIWGESARAEPRVARTHSDELDHVFAEASAVAGAAAPPAQWATPSAATPTAGSEHATAQCAPQPGQEGDDWRAACEAAGVVLKAPSFP
jgi:hypothetical protein